MKLFISYARVDRVLCENIVNRLNRAHEVWYDHRLHAGQAWWETILEKLDWCDGVVYLMSPESLTSEYCQREVKIAQDAGKYVFPVIIRHPRGERLSIPASLSQIHAQDLSESLDQIELLKDSLTVATQNLYDRKLKTQQKQSGIPDVKQAAAKTPATPSSELTPTAAIGQANEAMDAGDFDKAAFVLKTVLEKCADGSRDQRIIKTMLQEAEHELEQQAFKQAAEREYAPIKAAVLNARTRKLGCEEFADFATKFPNYDPDNLAKQCEGVAAKVVDVPLPTSISKRKEEGKRVKAVKDILPAPFDWCAIPSGQTTIQYGRITEKDSEVARKLNPPIFKPFKYWTYEVDSKQTFDVPTFAIAKYPVTNSQFAKFIDAGGYKRKSWWTGDGWAIREKENWSHPQFWTDSKWNGEQHPVVGISWYEAVAFCLWLSEASGEKIMLPTEQQWQRAAQALPDGRDSGYAYPWGNDWDGTRCNNSVEPEDSNVTTTVRHHEGKGDSSCKVVDLSGNVWEWCTTSYNEGTDDVNTQYEYRILRGGSWYCDATDFFRADSRNWYLPSNREDETGFRFVRS